jgi:hypothetical protein
MIIGSLFLTPWVSRPPVRRCPVRLSNRPVLLDSPPVFTLIEPISSR